MTRLRGVLQYCEATTVVKHCGVSAGAVHRKVVDAKEFLKYTRGVLRAYVKPAHLGALSSNLQPVLEGKRWKCFLERGHGVLAKWGQKI